MSENVKIALIGGSVSIVVALITAYFQTNVKLNAEKPNIIEDARKAIEISVTGVPIGTIASSMLEPHLFAELVGDKSNFDPTKSKWIPADGRSVAGSLYASKIASTIPDLRGMFLRGLNYSEKSHVRNDNKQDPEEGRQVGSYQADSLKRHEHGQKDGYRIVNFEGGGGWANTGGPHQDFRIWDSGNGKETRPKNIAVYFYIKIN